MARWLLFALYTAALFLSLPYTPRAIARARERFGMEPLIAGIAVVLALAGAVLMRRLIRTRAPWPHPHLALAALGIAAAGAWHLLASSPIGRVHLPEYALLAVLAGRAFGGATAGALGGGTAAAGIGLLDELVQGAIPDRVFDWWDVALNGAAALLGALVCAWWRWTAECGARAEHGGACEDRN